MKPLEKSVAEKLLKIKAVKLQPKNPFTWASGWKSPIYCDNRKILSYPEERTFICQKFCEIIREKYPQAEVIAGVATGAIAHGMLVAQELGLPFIYVRAKPKDHGLENLIEGDMKAGQKVVIIEDLVSTGLSSLKAADAITNFGGDVLGMVAIFTYNFPQARKNFEDAGLELTALSRYQILIEQAMEIGDVKPEEVEKLNKWREQPESWGK